MKLLNKVLGENWCIFGITEIPDHEDPTEVYLKRWRLVDFPRLFGIKLHHIRMSDNPETRGLHDHPWSFISIRLRRNYTELRPGVNFLHFSLLNQDRQWTARAGLLSWVFTEKRRRRWSFTRCTDLHAVQLDDTGRGCWTLVLNGPRVREWGFRFPGGEWMPWHQLDGAHARNVRGRAGSVK